MTIEQKLEIIAEVEKGKKSRQVIAQQYGIGKTTVHDIHRQREKIMRFASNQNLKRRRVDQKAMEKNDLDLKEVFKAQNYELVPGEYIEEVLEYQEEDFQPNEEEEFELVYDEVSVANDESYEKPLTMSGKRKSKTLTFREKYEIIRQVEKGHGIPLLCQAYGIGRTTVYDYMKRKNEIIDFVEKSDDVERRTFKRSKYPEIEEQLIDWCESRDTFTRPEFFEAAKGFFEKAQHSADVKTGFGGSWSWGKRFFHRHPELKRKVLNAEGQPMDPSELIISMVESEDGVETEYRVMAASPKNVLQKKPVVVLSQAKKLQLIQDFENGLNAAEIGEKFNISKTTVYSTISKRAELLRGKSNDQKENKTPRYPKLEAELLAWCLKEKRVPLPLVAITDKARCLFDDMALPGNFAASNTWAKQFVQRHPELMRLQNTNFDEEEDQEEELLFDDPSYEMEEPEDGYVVEELYEDEQELDYQELENEEMVTDDTARSCLETLMKYYEQRGLDDIWADMKVYHDQLSYDSS